MIKGNLNEGGTSNKELSTNLLSRKRQLCFPGVQTSKDWQNKCLLLAMHAYFTSSFDSGYLLTKMQCKANALHC